ncbi:hypothetical protein LLG95_12875 [bacterium]|nr:hypothetical protein [bacterium]
MRALENEAPTTFDLFGNGLVLLPRHEVTVAEVGVDLWDGVVSYDGSRGNQTDTVLSFDTSGGTQHVTHSKSIEKYGGEDAPEPHGMIGATKDGIEGVDITVPVFRFTEQHTLPGDVVNDVYKMILFALTGKVNEQAFRGFPQYTVLFLGAAGSRRGDGQWEITFYFAASPNIFDLYIGEIGPIAKWGWNYLWVYCEDVQEGNALVKKPKVAYVARVYDPAPFSYLGIDP